MDHPKLVGLHWRQDSAHPAFSANKVRASGGSSARTVGSSATASTFRFAIGSFVRRTHFLAISAVQQDASWYCVQYLSWAGNSVGVEKGLCISFWR